MSEENGKNIVESAIDAGLLAGQTVHEIDGHQFIVVPEDAQVDDLERFRNLPARKRGTIHVLSPESLIEYVKRHKDATSLIFALPPGPGHHPEIVAVLNHHGEEPGWCDHQVLYDFRPTTQWNRWAMNNGNKLEQRAFAEFLEDNIPDIVNPDAKSLLEACSTLTARRKVEYKSATRLTDGTVDFQYSENAEEGGGAGAVKLPQTFVLGLEPYEGAGKYEVSARLRWRIGEDRSLSFIYVLDQPEDVQRHAFDLVHKQIDQETQVTVLLGSP